MSLLSTKKNNNRGKGCITLNGMEGDVQVWSGLAPSSLLARVGISALCFHCLQFGFGIPRWPETVLLPELKPSNVLSDAFTRTMEGSLFWRNTVRPRQVPMILILDTRDWYRVQDYWCFGPKARGSDETLLLLIMLSNNALVFVSSYCCCLRILAMPSSCL